MGILGYKPPQCIESGFAISQAPHDAVMSQFPDRHHELLKIDYLQQSEAALQNCKPLLLLKKPWLMGCNLEWVPPLPIVRTQTGDNQLAVLSQSITDNDGDASDTVGGSGGEDGTPCISGCTGQYKLVSN